MTRPASILILISNPSSKLRSTILGSVLIFAFWYPVRAAKQSQDASQSQGAAKTPGSVTIIVTDLGVNQSKPGLEPLGDFQQLDNKAVVPVANRAQILLPMPPADQLPPLTQGWSDLANQMYPDVSEKIKSAVAAGSSTVEIRIVEDVNIKNPNDVLEYETNNLLGYKTDDEKQLAVENYTAAALHASLQAAGDIPDSNVVLGCGSNGCRSMVDVIPQLPAGDRESVDLFANVSSQGSVDNTLRAFELLPNAQNEIFDATADFPGGVGNLSNAELLKQMDPSARLFVVDPQLPPSGSIPGVDWWANHILVMKDDRPPSLFCEYNGAYCGPSQPLDYQKMFTEPMASNSPTLDINLSSSPSQDFAGLRNLGNSQSSDSLTQPGMTPNTNIGTTDIFGINSANPDIVEPASVPELRRTLENLQQQLSSSNQAVRRAQDGLRLEEQKNIAAGVNGAQEPMRITIPIPPGWVPCTCPDQHPGAGIFVNGVQYHTPALHCQ